jgi:membrane-bound metal-dependent hydrolase YbcI (DUF457 family)
MFIGHFAVGFAAKRVAPKASLGALLAAPLLLDLLWPIFLLAGVEWFRIAPGDTRFTPMAFDHYPWSHSLLMTLVWALLFGGGYWVLTRYRPGALAIGAGVISHWVLDWITHRPDMPLWPGGPLEGLGLWNSIPATVIVESVMFIAGVALYFTSTRSRDRTGTVAAWAMVVLLAVMYVLTSVTPPPSSTRAIAIGGLTVWLFPLWAWWLDRHREPVL